MSRTVYVVERVVLDVTDFERPIGYWDWTGSNGDHRARVPVAAFADRAAAERHADRLERGELAEFSPAWFQVELSEPVQTKVRAVLGRHGLTAPPFRFWGGSDELTAAIRFADWWAANGAAVPTAALPELWAALAPAAPLYRVASRTLED